MKIIKEHKIAAIIFLIIVIVMFILGYVFNALFGEQTKRGNSAIEKYYGGYYDITPFEERGNPQKESNYFHQNNMGVFTSVSSVLVADYYINDYQEQKEILITRKTDESVGEKWNAESFSINEWNFIVDKESSPANSLSIFGFNDKKHKIAYVKFNDNDLDIISDSPQDFFDTYIKYHF